MWERNTNGKIAKTLGSLVSTQSFHTNGVQMWARLLIVREMTQDFLEAESFELVLRKQPIF